MIDCVKEGQVNESERQIQPFYVHVASVIKHMIELDEKFRAIEKVVVGRTSSQNECVLKIEL